LIEAEIGEVAWAFIQVAHRQWGAAVELLSGVERVLEVAAVYGESADLIVKLEASRADEVFGALHTAFDRGLLLGPPTIRRARRAIGTPARAALEAGMLAYVLMKVPAKHLDGVLERLRSFEGVSEASVIYGETDVIAKVEVSDQDALDDLIIRRIQGLDEVEATRTFLAVGGMHWQRT
jgi:DNA-binding Lrp family transcriptional regulator